MRYNHTTTKVFLSMKNPLLFIIPVILLAVSSCKKSDTPTENINITSDESANIIAGALANNSNGLVAFSADISLTSQVLFDTGSGCGSTRTDDISHQSIAGAPITFSYSYLIANQLNCDANSKPDNITSTLTYNGSYDGPKLSLVSNGTTTATVTGLNTSSANYTINGELQGSGGFKLKTDTTKKGNVIMDITLKDAIITKATINSGAAITGGTAMATITGTSAKGAFSFNGTITFTGSNNAVLALGNGAYSINLITGAVLKL